MVLAPQTDPTSSSSQYNYAFLGRMPNTEILPLPLTSNSPSASPSKSDETCSQMAFVAATLPDVHFAAIRAATLRAMIVVGVGVGFLFALLVLAISVVSFPLLLDRDVGLYTAVMTSIRAVLANPAPMAIWGLIVAGGLVIGSIPLLLGLAIVMPVLGHATWHLYRKVVP